MPGLQRQSNGSIARGSNGGVLKSNSDGTCCCGQDCTTCNFNGYPCACGNSHNLVTCSGARIIAPNVAMSDSVSVGPTTNLPNTAYDQVDQASATISVSAPAPLPGFYGYGTTSGKSIGVYYSYDLNGSTYTFDGMAGSGATVSPTISQSGSASGTYTSGPDGFGFTFTNNYTNSVFQRTASILAQVGLSSYDVNYGLDTVYKNHTTYTRSDGATGTRTNTFKHSGGTLDASGSVNGGSVNPSTQCDGTTQTYTWTHHGTAENANGDTFDSPAESSGNGSYSLSLSTGVNTATLDCTNCPPIITLSGTVWVATRPAPPYTGRPGYDESEGDAGSPDSSDDNYVPDYPEPALVKACTISARLTMGAVGACDTYTCLWTDTNATVTGPTGISVTTTVTLTRVAPQLYLLNTGIPDTTGDFSQIYLTTTGACATETKDVQQRPLPVKGWDSDGNYTPVYAGQPTFTSNVITIGTDDCKNTDPTYICDPNCNGCKNQPDAPETIDISAAIDGEEVDFTATRDGTNPLAYSFSFSYGGHTIDGTLAYEAAGTDDYGKSHNDRYRLKAVDEDADEATVIDDVAPCKGKASYLGDYTPTPGSGFEDDATVSAAA